jgi:hypothetical protein
MSELGTTATDGLAGLRRALRMVVVSYVWHALTSLPCRLAVRCDGLHPCCRQ